MARDSINRGCNMFHSVLSERLATVPRYYSCVPNVYFGTTVLGQDCWTPANSLSKYAWFRLATTIPFFAVRSYIFYSLLQQRERPAPGSGHPAGALVEQPQTLAHASNPSLGSVAISLMGLFTRCIVLYCILQMRKKLRLGPLRGRSLRRGQRV